MPLSRDAKKPAGTEVILGDTDDGWDAASKPVATPTVTIPTSGGGDYEVLGDLARGSMGAIKIARDRSLQRLVALKMLDPTSSLPNAAARFLDEARITAQLQHPSIVPVYAIGTIGDDPYFTMQLIEGRTLRDVVDKIAQRQPDDLVRYGRVRLLNVLIQVCNSIAYAHSRGVIHRDLKPANIMLGEFGEVFVMDWGLAKIIKSSVERPVVGGRPDQAGFNTRIGDVTGTPAYMAPEQAMGLVDALSERSDVFALGAILYELLTGRPPFVADSMIATLRLAQHGQIQLPSAVAPEADILPALEAVTMRCLARDPMDRYASAGELRDEIEGCVTNRQTIMHRVRGTASVLRKAARAGQRFRELARTRRQTARTIATTEALRLPSDPIEMIEAHWADVAALRLVEAELDSLFDQAVAQFHQVLSEQPDSIGAQEGLRDLFWYRFLEAERFGDDRAMAVYRSLAAQHDPNAVLRAAIEGRGELNLSVDPTPSHAEIVALTQGPLHVSAAEPQPIQDAIAMGSCLLRLQAPGHVPTIASLWIGRQETVELSVRLPRIERLPQDMVYVPGGSFWRGTRLDFVKGPPRLRMHQDAFCIARTPVTIAEWAAFVDAGPGADLRLPPAADWQVDRDGRAYPAQPAQNPMTGLSLRLIRAYCQWRTDLDALPWRLPTAGEWEKAARGADGRCFPWGDVWEPMFCRCAESPEGGAPGAVGAERDVSVYGVHDLAGGVREWTRTEHPRDPRRRVIKGGGFLSSRPHCHLGAATFRRMDHGAVDLGFRLALDASAVFD
ncbi:MAG: serine/threonine protein kinase/formylglycine-generating enzyme required for sulfatase activity [Bradymonadia bacterium]|jgi:serine/threonine protein kinase/formylglycine-generating enzyme required for sulfatase activity